MRDTFRHMEGYLHFVYSTHIQYFERINDYMKKKLAEMKKKQEVGIGALAGTSRTSFLPFLGGYFGKVPI